MTDCPVCKGKGVIPDQMDKGSVIDCPRCEGTGELLEDEVCSECGNVEETGACYFCKAD